jgi:hypothetical protein
MLVAAGLEVALDVDAIGYPAAAVRLGEQVGIQARLFNSEVRLGAHRTAFVLPATLTGGKRLRR